MIYILAVSVLIAGVCIYRALKEKPPIISDESEYAQPTHLCSNCLSEIKPDNKVQGSGFLGLLLLLLFLLPGIIYFIWLSSTKKPRCPLCGAKFPVPLNSPAAANLFAKQVTRP